ncbi:trypsin-like peptidase domain-containing protein [Roseofilum sp. BLCC_M154]|uniref:Trypsin-like peptidase domain-containing protein n=1 Tax=Roseofilum acuticapitatum BLCC-M154 TaxID=3022444 RepID=A0ABT7AV09_9CYAN|nr:trypsin-like peptidase domain-containing protein [Roseofilum acuticapitatum]MDJ1170747.1 trypsin-like peptidase domain-containing protein [Roseofilum acuticapitatum BLCC-M154]
MYTRFLSAALLSLAPSLALTLPSVANPVIDRIASEITVRIEGPQGGSGVIFTTENQVYYVVTNAHVVDRTGDYTIITPDGDRYRVSPSHRLRMPGEDIAILAFHSPKTYRTADIGNPEAEEVGNPIYVAGWPRSGGSVPQRIFVNTEGELIQLLQGVDQSQLPLNYTNIVRVGMSGGPVLNKRGEIIGINRLVQLVEDTDQIVAAGIKIDKILTWWESTPKPTPTAADSRAVVSETPAPATEAVVAGGYQLSQTLHREGGFLGAVVIGDTILISGHSDGQIILWNLATGESIKTLTGHQKAINTLVITPDGKTLISGSEDRTIKLWNLPSGELQKTLTGHRDAVSALALSPDGQTLVSGGWDQQVIIWNLNTYEILETLAGHQGLISSLAISADGKWLISGSQDTTIRVWELPSFKLTKVLKGHRLSVLALALSVDSQTLASSGGEGDINIWSLATGELQRTLKGHTDGVWSLALEEDNQTLISGSWDKTIRFWNIQTGQLQSTVKEHSDYVVFLGLSAKDRRLVSGGLDNQILIWQHQGN